MRGQSRTLADALAQALSAQPQARRAALSAAFADACGARLAREASLRGPLPDGRLLVVVRSAAWADQLQALEPQVCTRIEARVGPGSAPGLSIRVGQAR